MGLGRSRLSRADWRFEPLGPQTDPARCHSKGSPRAAPDKTKVEIVPESELVEQQLKVLEILRNS